MSTVLDMDPDSYGGQARRKLAKRTAVNTSRDAVTGGFRGSQRALNRAPSRVPVLGASVSPDTALIGCLVLCVIVIAAEAFTGTDSEGSADAPTWGHSFLIREMAVSFVFMVLALVAMMGKTGGQAAIALGLLVTGAVLLNMGPLLAYLNTALGSANSKASESTPASGGTAATPATAKSGTPTPASVSLPLKIEGEGESLLKDAEDIANDDNPVTEITKLASLF